MHLLSISIKNFRVIQAASFDLPDKVIGIIGPNGAGKSSIVEAIAWALYGNVAARSAKDEIRSTMAGSAATTEVELAFEIHGEHYRVIRRLIGRAERPEVMLFRSGSSESVGSTETQKHIAELLGLDWKGFLTSFLARQQELNALSDLPAGKRREHLAAMLGIGRLDKVLTLIKGDNRSSSERGTLLRQQLSEKDQLTERLTQIAIEHNQLQTNRVTVLGALESCQKKADQEAALVKAGEQQQLKCSQLEAKLITEERSANLITNQLSSQEREHGELTKLAAEAPELLKKLAVFDETKAKFDREHEAAKVAELSKELTFRRSTLAGELKEAMLQADKASTSQANLKSQLDDIPEAVGELAHKAAAQLDLTRERYSDTRATREVALQEVTKLTDQIARIGEVGPETVCDRCHRPFGDDLNMIAEHLAAELKSARQTFDEQEVRLKVIKADGEEIKKDAERLQQLLADRKDLNQKLKQQVAESSRQAEISDKLKSQLDELSKRIEKDVQVTFDQERYDQLKKKLAELETGRRNYDQIIGRLDRLEDLKTQLSETKIKLEQILKVKTELNQELAAIGFDSDAFEKIVQTNRTALEQVETKKTQLVEVTKEIEVIEKELLLRNEQLEKLAAVERELDEAQSALFYGEKLGGLFGDFRKYLIARIRPRLAEISTTLFAEMTGDKYGLVELDADYNLRILDHSQMFGVQRFSGGEKDLANLCLRLAISLALTESANLDRSFVILDEVFGSQDVNRRDLIFKGLANLKKRFPQILLVTHVGEIKNRVETLIEIEPTNSGWSEVRVDGQLV